MNKETLAEVEREARELLRRIEALRKDDQAMRFLGIVGSPKTSAVRRQSMELSRALARMRKPG